MTVNGQEVKILDLMRQNHRVHDVATWIKDFDEIDYQPGDNATHVHDYSPGLGLPNVLIEEMRGQPMSIFCVFWYGEEDIFPTLEEAEVFAARTLISEYDYLTEDEVLSKG